MQLVNSYSVSVLVCLVGVAMHESDNSMFACPV